MLVNNVFNVRREKKAQIIYVKLICTFILVNFKRNIYAHRQCKDVKINKVIYLEFFILFLMSSSDVFKRLYAT